MRVRENGFTLVELACCVVVLVILSGFAVPRFITLDQQARAATVTALAGTLNSTAADVRSLCASEGAAAGCSLTAGTWVGRIGAREYWLNYGWPDSGDELAGRQIDALVDGGGFRTYLVDNAATRWVRDDAPRPDRCSVTYVDANTAGQRYQLVIDTTGC